MKGKFLEAVILVIVLAIGILYITQGDEVLLSPEGVDYLGSEMASTYSGGETITGTVNLSFDGALANANLSSNFQGSISLIDFLEANDLDAGGDFNCSTSNCEPDYSPDGEVSSLTVSGEKKIVGFSITGDEVSGISDATLILNSNVGASCLPLQLSADILDKKEAIVVNNATTGQSCAFEYTGCFNPAASSADVIINNNDEYCEKMTLPSAPGYSLGARIKDSTTGTSALKMRLYNNDTEMLGECVLPGNFSDSYTAVSCVVNYPAPTQEEYFVCVTAASSGSNYKIKFETSSPVCGTKNFGTLNTDYDLFAKTMEYAPVSNFKVHEVFEQLYNMELADYIGEYITEKYGNVCEPHCTVPIAFTGQAQEVQLSGAIQYSSQQGVVESNNIYELESTEALVDSGKLKLNLEKANFVIPLGTSEKKFKLYFDDELVFEKNLNITPGFSFDVKPKFAAFGQNVLFSAITTQNVSSSTWDFGDGTIETVAGKQIFHRYTSPGSEFSLKTTLKKASGETATKNFTIVVGDPQTSANLTIAEYKKRIKNLNVNFNLYPTWVKQGLQEKIDLEELNNSINIVESKFKSALSEQDFQDVMLELVELKIPKSINVTKKGSPISLLIGFDNVDTSYIQEISGTQVSDEEELKNKIGGWTNTKFDAKISFEQISAVYDSDSEVVLSKFKIDTNPREPVDRANYLIIGHSVEENGKFMSAYGQRTLSGASYIDLNGAGGNFEFYIYGDFEPQELGTHISPDVQVLGEFGGDLSVCNLDNICDSGETQDNCPADCGTGRGGLAILWILIIIIGGLIVYIIMQEWYKRYYERSLFKTQGELYNLISFIYNARKIGLSESEIKEKLKERSWSSEQINYALRKINGKRTGMYEIPIFKFIENRRVREEIAKRQGGKVDVRFIKR